MSEETVRKKQTAPPRTYSDAFRRMVVKEYEKGMMNKDQLQRKYGISGNSRLLDWCRKFGKLHYPIKGNEGRPMKDPQKQRIEDLEKQLADEKLKVMAYERLIAIAEKEEGICILKKGVAERSRSLGSDTHEK